MPEETRITDLGEAAALLTLGFDLVKLEQSPQGPFKIFVFARSHPAESTSLNVDDAIELYQRRKLAVDAYSYYRSSKELKTRIHDHNLSNGAPS